MGAELKLLMKLVEMKKMEASIGMEENEYNRELVMEAEEEEIETFEMSNFYEGKRSAFREIEHIISECM